MRYLVAILSLATLLAACSPSITVRVGEWQVRCQGVASPDCEGVGRLFVNNLARSWHSVFEQSRGVVMVTPRPVCPEVPDPADRSFCWQASALVDEGTICMIVARSFESPLGFGQVGGDILGRALGPPPTWPRCQRHRRLGWVGSARSDVSKWP